MSDDDTEPQPPTPPPPPVNRPPWETRPTPPPPPGPPTPPASPGWSPPPPQSPGPPPAPSAGWNPPPASPPPPSAAWGAPAPSGGWSPQPQYATGVAPKRRGWAWLWLLIGALVVMIGFAVGGSVLAVGTLTKPADATNTYLRALQRQHYPVAYGQLCAARRGETSGATFADEQAGRVQSDGAIRDFNVYWSFVTSDNHATTRYTIDRNLLEQQRFEVDLVREDGHWRLCHFQQLAD